MRGLLVVNPKATTTSPRVTDVLIHALADELDLDVTVTNYRGHGFALGAQARTQELDVVLTLGGDGVVNEVVNGMLIDGPGPKVPMLATVPGGSGNVFARALGLPNDPVEATGQLLDALRERRFQTIGLGTVTGLDSAGTVDPQPIRWFTANAGVGLDAEIISAMEHLRGSGETATPTRYLRTALHAFFLRTDRKHPALTLHRAGTDPVTGVFMAVVQNTSPWTYFGTWPIDPCPQATFETGLDIFALRAMRVAAAMRAARRMVMSSRAGSSRKAMVVWHDQSQFTITADRPIPIQIDGESGGQVTEVTFTSVPAALRAMV
ncbi:MAG: diacylglycerol kinase family protein [Actinomycetota bacterium]|nr:diacylglycerol kinase family protein [Actinomycetota bacterium]